MTEHIASSGQFVTDTRTRPAEGAEVVMVDDFRFGHWVRSPQWKEAEGEVIQRVAYHNDSSNPTFNMLDFLKYQVITVRILTDAGIAVYLNGGGTLVGGNGYLAGNYIQDNGQVGHGSFTIPQSARFRIWAAPSSGYRGIDMTLMRLRGSDAVHGMVEVVTPTWVGQYFLSFQGTPPNMHIGFDQGGKPWDGTYEAIGYP